MRRPSHPWVPSSCLTTSKSNQLGLSITPDGTRLIVRETVAGLSPDLRVLELSRPTPEGQAQVAPLLRGTYVEDNGVVSPDGHWIAYESNESSESQIYVRPFPDVGAGRWQISADGGTKPLWAPNGRELFYLDAGRYLTAVPVQTSPTFSRGNPTKLLNTRYFTSQVRNFDVTRDGQKFLMIKESSETDNKTSASAPGTMTVVVNWIEELKAKTGGK
jgi:eukaryotic-like serine/threonine-protein kinase